MASDTIEIPLGNSGLVTVIDAEDYERNLTCHFRDGFTLSTRICDSSWCASGARGYTCYAVSQLQNRSLRLHRLLTNAPALLEVDHIDRDGLNNRRLNLRVVNRSQNCMNQRTKGGSKYRGVSWHQQRRKWRARLTVNGTGRHIGLFDSEVSAALAYNAAATNEYGSLAYLNVIGDGQ